MVTRKKSLIWRASLYNPHERMMMTNDNAYMWLMIVAMGILIFLMNIDYTAVNLTLVPIASELDVTLSDLQWLLSGYVLVWAAFVIPAGRLADRMGKVPALNAGLFFFMMGSGLTGFGHSLTLLIGGRLLQGMGAALMSVPIYGLIFSSAPPHKQGMALGAIMSMASVGGAIGPTFGGWLISDVGWRWIFFINIPLCLVVAGMMYAFARKETVQQGTAPIDPKAVALLSAGIGALMFALNQIEVWGFMDVRLLAIMGGGLCALIIFAMRDRLQKEPFLPSSLLKLTPYRVVIAGIFAGAYYFSSTLILAGLYLQKILKLSSFDAGIMFLFMTVAMGVFSLISGRLADRYDIRVPVVGGFIVSSMAMGMMLFFDVSSSSFYVALTLLMAGAGSGLQFSALNTAMFKSVPKDVMNTGSAIFTMAMMLGNTVGLIFSTSFVVLWGRGFLEPLLHNRGIPLESVTIHMLSGHLAKVNHTFTPIPGMDGAQMAIMTTIVDEAFTKGLHGAFAVCLILVVVAACMTLRYLNIKRHHGGALSLGVGMT